jgi:hypothetical protein
MYDKSVFLFCYGHEVTGCAEMRYQLREIRTNLVGNNKHITAIKREMPVPQVKACWSAFSGGWK